MNCRFTLALIGLTVCLAVSSAMPLHAQVGKSLGVVDVNTATEQALVAMPHM